MITFAQLRKYIKIIHNADIMLKCNFRIEKLAPKRFLHAYRT